MALNESPDQRNINHLIGLITTSNYFERAFAESEEVRERVRAVVHGYNPNPNTETGTTKEVPGGDYATVAYVFPDPFNFESGDFLDFFCGKVTQDGTGSFWMIFTDENGQIGFCNFDNSMDS